MYEINAFNAAHSDLQIQLIVEDGKCEGRASSSAAQKLVDVDQVQAIV
jgi:ABC-type branched-subunit amino acid transport system substrate-binding protein